MQKKYLLLIVVIFGFFLTLKAQSPSQIKLDSLLVVWNDITKHDTTRLKAVRNIAWEVYRFKNPDSAIYYAQLQYDLAESSGHKKWTSSAFNTQAFAYSQKGQIDKSLDYYTRSMAISDEIGDKQLKAVALNNISSIYRRKGDFDKALETYAKSLKIFEELNDKKKVGLSLANMGILYNLKGDVDKAIDYLKRGNKISEELGNLDGLAGGLNTIAYIYFQQGNTEEALKLFTENLENYKKLEHEMGIAGTISNIGEVYAEQENYPKALENLAEALKGFEKIGAKHGVAGMANAMGTIYFKQKKYPLALEYNKKSLEIYKEIGYSEGIAAAEDIIARVYTTQGLHDKALMVGNNALTLSKESGNLTMVKTISENLVTSYKASGNYKKAFEMNELYFETRDSLDSKENQKAFIELQVQSDYDKQKAVDDVENEKEIAIATQKTNAQRNISIAIGVALLLISLLAYIIFNRLKITRQQKAIIEEQKKKVELSEKYKEQFLANMSHEIRTPMHAISGMLKILKRNNHPATQDVFLKAMQTSSDNLVVILNDVLDLSKIEAGKLDIESIPINPRLVIENVNQILTYKAEEKGLKLSYKIDDTIPHLVMGDPTRMNQILVNLVGNAIKFTETGTVDILLKEENNQLYFQVQDTGIGISIKEQENIFAAFEQAKNSTARHFGGTGLGLSISKQLVELQEGKIWLESTEDVGSTFYVTLPLIVAKSDAIGADLISEEKLKAMADSLQGIRILIAEDNPFNQMIAQDDLNFHIQGIQIETVENGTLAVEKFKAEQFDLILMDVQMPEMNGFDATRKIREIEKQENRNDAIPIIAMTASLLKTEINSCFEAGMDNYIPKPYSTEELIVPIFKELRV